jgi:hypothetical protein
LACRPVQGAKYFKTGLAALPLFNGLAFLLFTSLAIKAILLSTPLRFAQNVLALLRFSLYAGSLPLFFPSLPFKLGNAIFFTQCLCTLL